MTEVELLQAQIKALTELLAIKDQTIQALKDKPAQIQYVPQYVPYYQSYPSVPYWQWNPWNITYTYGAQGVAHPNGASGGIQNGIGGLSGIVTSGYASSAGCASNATDVNHPNNQNSTFTSTSACIPNDATIYDGLGNVVKPTNNFYLSLAK